jgi:hypothetical protein
LDITESQYHFRSLCGRKPGWLNATKAFSRTIGTQTLVTLSMNIELCMNQKRYRATQKSAEVPENRLAYADCAIA